MVGEMKGDTVMYWDVPALCISSLPVVRQRQGFGWIHLAYFILFIKSSHMKSDTNHLVAEH
jgi:hypothetical protein